MNSYGQWCGVAKALDLVGERWTLLIVRELLEGPKRYTDLRDGIPGVATDVLAARLRSLEERGVVARRTLPPPAASKVYELTAFGRGLEPVLLSLALWGAQVLGPLEDGEVFRPHWLAIALRGLLDRDAAEGVTLELAFVLTPGEVVRIRVDDGTLDHVAEPMSEADVTITADHGTLAALATGTLAARDALADGRLTITGGRDAVRTYGRLFRRSRP